MKNKILISLIAVSLGAGCTTVPNSDLAYVGPYQVAPREMVPQSVVEMGRHPGTYVVKRANSFIGAGITQPINDPQILISQINQLIGGVMGPNKVSGSLLTSQNYYRETQAVINNPWIGVSTLRNNWVK